MKYLDLKTLYLKHNDELFIHLESAKNEELYEIYNELCDAFIEEDLEPIDLEIHSRIEDLLYMVIAQRWLKEYRDFHNFKLNNKRNNIYKA